MTISSSSATTGLNHTGLNRTIRTLTNFGYPIGKGLLDNVGDGSVSGRGYTDGPVTFTGAGGYGGVFGPIAVLGLATDGQLRKPAQAGIGATGDRNFKHLQPAHRYVKVLDCGSVAGYGRQDHR